ncbi:conserved hypothetical protein [Talaromyces stipitatus ATCC 10500]|uniref:C2H2-type domain-containing protein n=1 Tax=Talaromyces stipitatus (strain ATCC 10500 / CBS 375.48 / QM 6759 / NRRL 1006) TaxID=441959 RepID=B8M601_TALSN|nr:uncharacterized protein TSTA_033700 [Talaromyces stipitatus ATCC 10500]EED20128.1 conserved hypothetical protein [Talaromyces stipitatus ATCC 10500]
MNITFGTDDFLHYNAQYKLLICLKCKYAIQKTAVGNHLLRHKIYRAERQRLLSAISDLELLEPDDVQFPLVRCEPVEGLPVIAGYKCTATDCGSLYASIKRMRRHWRESHGLSDLPQGYACAVYFEATGGTPSVAEPVVLADDRRPEEQRQKRQYANTMSHAQPDISNRSPKSDLGLDQSDLLKMRYFHHFITTTCLTLPAGSSNPVNYWKTNVVTQALRLEWLMYGLLSISASHLAVLSEDRVLKDTHVRRSRRFYRRFESGMGETDYLEMEVQMLCIHRLIFWTSEGRVQLPVPLDWLVATVKGCTNPKVTLDSMARFSGGYDVNLDRLWATHPPDSNTSLRTDISRSSALKRIFNLPYRLTEKLGRPDDVTDFIAVMSAIRILIESYHQSFDAENLEIVWMGMNGWLSKVSDRFTRMAIVEKKPAALTVFAYWLLLVARAEQLCWFLRGLSMNLLHQVAEDLGEDSGLRDLVEELI